MKDKMRISRCKLEKDVQSRLLWCFVNEVTARKSAAFVGINHNSAALFFHKLREVIAYHLPLEFGGRDPRFYNPFPLIKEGAPYRNALSAGRRAYYGLKKANQRLFWVECEFRASYDSTQKKLEALQRWCDLI